MNVKRELDLHQIVDLFNDFFGGLDERHVSVILRRD